MARAYVAEHPRLAEVLAHADRVSGSTGVQLADSVFLHKAVLRLRPTTVLECGTGRSTFVLAQAMAEAAQPGTRPRLVSMEHDRAWFEAALRAFPKDEFPFVEIVHSPQALHGYSFVRGTVYSSVPTAPYDLVFVDGPGQEMSSVHPHTMCNLDFIRLVEQSDRPVRAIIDNRKHTVLAYTVILGRAKVRFFPGGRGQGSLGIVAPVTRKDLLLADKMAMRKTLFPEFASEATRRWPSWKADVRQEAGASTGARRRGQRAGGDGGAGQADTPRSARRASSACPMRASCSAPRCRCNVS